MVIDVHARDVVKLLVDRGVSDLTDFDWISQLRFYWEEGNAMVSSITLYVVQSCELFEFFRRG